MKVANVCGASSGVSGGRVARPRRDVENEEVQMYLSKLKELVPFMPKHKKLSKLEVIQYVIDYICDLQEALETTPVVQITNNRSPNRQPLGVLAPNTIVPPSSCATQETATVGIFMFYAIYIIYLNVPLKAPKSGPLLHPLGTGTCI